MTIADEMESRTALGNLLLQADECSKRVITAYNPTAARTTTNTTALSRQFNLDMLEPCATFLGIDLADNDGNKMFTKKTLVSRIILAIESFLPATCSECSEKYSTQLNAEEKPLFFCFLCFQGSHNCEAVKAHHNDNENSLKGSIWLCHHCLVSKNPVEPRKTRVAHEALPETQQQDATVAEATGSEPATEALIPKSTDDATVKICEEYKVGKCPHGIHGTIMVDGHT